MITDLRPSTPVITGLGCISPLGQGADAQLTAMAEDRVGTGPFKSMEQAEAVAQEGLSGGECSSLDGVSIHERAAQGLAIAVREALAGARVDPDAPPYAAQRIAAVLGTSLHGMNAAGAWLRGESTQTFEYFQAGMVLNRALAGLPIGGARVTCSSACASSFSSVAHARTLLETGAADMVICGGYDPVSEYAVAGFHSLQVVSPDRLRPFAADRKGMQVSEGYGVFVLERADDAAKRGAMARAMIGGIGESSDAHHLTQPHPDGAGAAAVLRDALSEAGLEPEAIGLIIAHATGTRDNDAAEAKAYNHVFGPSTPPVAALKSRVGHTLGAAGALEACIARVCLDAKLMPSTANVRAQDVGEPINLLTDAPAKRDTDVGHAVSCSLGFGGANVSLIQTTPDHASELKRAPDQQAYRVGVVGVGTVLPGVIGPGVPSPDVLWQTGNIDPASTKAYLPRAKARRLSPLSRLALIATGLAFKDAGIDPAELPGLDAPAHLRPACLVATTNSSASFAYDYYRALVDEGYKAANPLMFAEGVPNAPAAHVSMFYKLHGSSQSIIGTHTSGIDALGLATMRIATGRWTTAVVCIAEEDHPLVREITHGFGHVAADAPPCEGAVAFVLRRIEPDQPAPIELHQPVYRSTDRPADMIAQAASDTSAKACICATDLRQDTALRDAGIQTLPHAPWFALGGGLGLLDAMGAHRTGPSRILAGCPSGLVSSIMMNPAAPEQTRQTP